MIEDVVRPKGPYRLHLMTFGRPAEIPLPGGGRAIAWQVPDGRVAIEAPDEAGLALARFCLALDDDHTEFARRFRRDPLLSQALFHLYGFRPLRQSTVARSVLHAVCGQLIQASRALQIERAIMRRIGEEAPTREGIGSLSPAELRRFGLATHRASTLVRVCRTIDLERLRDVPIAAAEARLLREPGLGPWSFGTIASRGLGSWSHGLVGDLTLVKLCSALWGRWAELDETAAVLEPYGEWAGLACAYLMRGFDRGLILGAHPDRARLVRSRMASAA